MQKPNYHTINRFRSTYMKEMMDASFKEMITLLMEQKYISMENYFLDGTKIEANANKYSFVWKKATKRFEHNLQEKIKETLCEIEELAKEDESFIVEQRSCRFKK